jgi:hypothetical protein
MRGQIGSGDLCIYNRRDGKTRRLSHCYSDKGDSQPEPLAAIRGHGFRYGHRQVYAYPSGRSVEVIECDMTVLISANQTIPSATGDEESALAGRGGFAIDQTGVLIGGGTYFYVLVLPFIPPDPSITCDTLVRSTTYSTFDVYGSTPVDSIQFGIHLSPFDSSPAVANCVDSAHRHTQVTAFPSRSIDPNQSLNLDGLVCTRDGCDIPFQYGNGTGIVNVFPREK